MTTKHTITLPRRKPGRQSERAGAGRPCGAARSVAWFSSMGIRPPSAFKLAGREFGWISDAIGTASVDGGDHAATFDRHQHDPFFGAAGRIERDRRTGSVRDHHRRVCFLPRHAATLAASSGIRNPDTCQG
jgi:hypothetical protein